MTREGKGNTIIKVLIIHEIILNEGLFEWLLEEEIMNKGKRKPYVVGECPCHHHLLPYFSLMVSYMPVSYLPIS